MDRLTPKRAAAIIEPAVDPTIFWWWLPIWRDDEESDKPGLEEVTLRDGRRAWVRPLLPSDREAHAAHYRDLSAESKYQRFLSEIPELSDDLLRRLVDEVDGIDHVAYYLFLDASALPVGIGRIVRDPQHPECADVAVTVQDAYQGQGVATALLQVLVARRPEGVTTIQTVVAATNKASLAMLKRLGPTHVAISDGVAEVRVDLTGEQAEALAALPPAPRTGGWRATLKSRDRVCPWLN